MSTLVLIRHGESVFNAQGRIQGQTCAGLTDLGHQQARAVAAWAGQKGWSAPKLFTSDLQRAQETSEHLAAALGGTARPDPELRERSCGRWEGAHPDDLSVSEPDLWARWRAHEDVLAEVGGESETELTARAVSALRAVLGQLGDGEVGFVVTHGGPCWYGVPALIGIPRQLLARPANAATIMLRSEQGKLRLETWNEQGHLLGRTGRG